MTRVLALTLVLAFVPGAPAEAERGMGPGNGPCYDVATATEQALMAGESRGWNTADNPSSSAFGCGQLVAAMRRAYYPSGCPINTLGVACQMAGLRAYIADRYGSAAVARAFQRARGWY